MRIKILVMVLFFCSENSYAGALDNLVNGLVELDLNKESEAISWFQKGALEGDSACLSRLANYFEAGLGIEKDEKKALKLRKRASKNGLVVFPGKIHKCYRAKNDFYLMSASDEVETESIYLLKNKSSIKNKVYEVNRWVQVAWSPNGDRLLVTDGAGSNVTDTFIYKIDESGVIFKELDPLSEFNKLAKDDLLEFEKDHFYFEGIEWINNDEILLNITGHSNEKKFYRIYLFNFKKGFTRLK